MTPQDNGPFQGWTAQPESHDFRRADIRCRHHAPADAAGIRCRTTQLADAADLTQPTSRSRGSASGHLEHRYGTGCCDVERFEMST